MDFSLILPTLGDKVKLKRFLGSIERTTRNKNLIEVLLALDDDDEVTQKWVEEQQYTFLIRFYKRPKTDNFSDDYYNYLADRSVGDNIWACNDDMWIKTQNWDDLARRKIDEYGWSVYLLDTLDTTRGRINIGFCCFPIISRKAVNEIGFFFYRQVRVYPADKTIYSLFHKIGRVIPCHELVIRSHYVSEDLNPRMWKIYQEDLNKGDLVVNITKEVMILLMATKDDRGKRPESKFKRIMKIIMEK